MVTKQTIEHDCLVGKPAELNLNLIQFASIRALHCICVYGCSVLKVRQAFL
jgi:hypothetical protein